MNTQSGAQPPTSMLDYVCPRCGHEALRESETSLDCPSCQYRAPLVMGIPRFVDDDKYAANFGLQWRLHPRIEHDSYNGTTFSSDRFFHVTGWPRNLEGWRVMEAGCGAGRFSEIVLGAGGELYSSDLSRAVEACHQNHGGKPGFRLCQADLRHLPLPKEAFDGVFCFGVVMCTPEPEESFRCLLRHVKPGGRIAIDCYRAWWGLSVQPRWLVRRLVRGVDPERLYRWARWLVPWLLPVAEALARLPGPLRYLAYLVPVYIAPHHPNLTRAMRLEWSLLGTYDQWSPRYDQPQTLEAVRGWFERAGLEEVEVWSGPNGVCARGRKPER